MLLSVSGPGTRAGWWPFQVGLGLFGGALLAGLAAAGAAIIGLAFARVRAGKVSVLAVALVLGGACAAVPPGYIHSLKTLPYINDITTDTERPPQFSPPKPYESHFPELQQIGYPDLRPLELALPPKQAFARALETVRAQGWQITALDESAGVIQAVAVTRWFGFKDDVAIRVTPAGAGSRVDMRSKSRVGRSDAGANARRIREFLAAVSG